MSTNDSTHPSPRQTHQGRLVTARGETNDGSMSSPSPALAPDEQNSHHAVTIQIGETDRPSSVEDASIPADTSLAQLEITPTSVEQTVTQTRSDQPYQSWVEILRNNPNTLHETQLQHSEVPRHIQRLQLRNSELVPRSQRRRYGIESARRVGPDREAINYPYDQFGLLAPGYPLPRLYENLLFEPRPSEQDLNSFSTFPDLPHSRQARLTTPWGPHINGRNFIEQEMAIRNVRMHPAPQQQQYDTTIDAEQEPVLIAIRRDIEDEDPVEAITDIQSLIRYRDRVRAAYYDRLREQARRYTRPYAAIHDQAPANHATEAEDQPRVVIREVEHLRDHNRAERYERLREQARRYTHPATIEERPATTNDQETAYHANEAHDQPGPVFSADGVEAMVHFAGVWEGFGRRINPAVPAQGRRSSAGHLGPAYRVQWVRVESVTHGDDEDINHDAQSPDIEVVDLVTDGDADDDDDAPVTGVLGLTGEGGVDDNDGQPSNTLPTIDWISVPNIDDDDQPLYHEQEDHITFTQHFY